MFSLSFLFAIFPHFFFFCCNYIHTYNILLLHFQESLYLSLEQVVGLFFFLSFLACCCCWCCCCHQNNIKSILTWPTFFVLLLQLANKQFCSFFFALAVGWLNVDFLLLILRKHLIIFVITTTHNQY